MGAPESFWVKITWSSSSPAVRFRILPPTVEAQKAQPIATAHLGGDADGVAVTIAHEDRLNAVAIGQLPQIFDGAVQLGDLLPGHHRRADATGLVDLGPEGLGDVRHLFGGGHAPAEPL